MLKEYASTNPAIPTGLPIINSQNFLQNDEENKSATDRGREANRSTPRYVMEGCTPSTPPLKTPYNISMAADCRKRHSLILLCK